MLLSSKSCYHRILNFILFLVKKQKPQRNFTEVWMGRLFWPLTVSVLKFNRMETRSDVFWNLKSGSSFRNVLLSFSFFPSPCFNFCSGEVNYKFPDDPKTAQLGLPTGILPHGLAARSVGMILEHLIFKTHTVGTDVFFRDWKMKFKNTEAWAMLESNIVSGHSVRLMPAANHSLSWWKAVYTICA